MGTKQSSCNTQLAHAAEHKPFVHYYGVVRTVMGLFAPAGVKEMDTKLVEFLGKFAVPVSRRAKQQQVTPDITAACFEMLGDALRWSNLANGSLQSEWLTEVFDAALVIIQTSDNIATHEAALTAVLRFFCSFLRWASEGPDVVQHAKPLWGEGRIGMLIKALFA
jgi:hypothetical protein